MIIDAHSHIWEEKLMSPEMEKIITTMVERLELQDPQQLRNGTIDRLLGEMDAAGIDKTVLLALDAGLAFRAGASMQDYNDYVAAIVKEHPDRIIGFCGIDPRRGKEGLVELERCADMGLTGLKLWTLTGFYPDDESYYPLYQRATELGFPMLFHTGGGPPGTYLKFNRPVYVDKVAVDLPEATIIMAHMGQPWVDEAVEVVGKNSNVYVDISAWEGIFKLAPFAFFQALVQLKTATGSMRQVLFGSDWPLFTPILSLKEWVEGIQGLTIPPPMQMMGFKDFSDEDKRLILGDNAARIFGLT
jgi:predicted TIM-barrel fold metal-dependent hydrolase